jgi:hypothetical protein
MRLSRKGSLRLRYSARHRMSRFVIPQLRVYVRRKPHRRDINANESRYVHVCPASCLVVPVHMYRAFYGCDVNISLCILACGHLEGPCRYFSTVQTGGIAAFVVRRSSPYCYTTEPHLSAGYWCTLAKLNPAGCSTTVPCAGSNEACYQTTTV